MVIASPTRIDAKLRRSDIPLTQRDLPRRICFCEVSAKDLNGEFILTFAKVSVWIAGVTKAPE